MPNYTTNYNLPKPTADEFYNIDVVNQVTNMVDAQLKANADAIAANATAIATKQAALGFTPENAANKGANNGYCPLDAGGKIPTANLPSSLLQYQSTWDASTNNPTLTATAAAKVGYYYKVTVAGTQFGIEFHVGDWLIYNTSGAAEKSDNSDEVTSVNGLKGAVTVQDVTNNLTAEAAIADADTFPFYDSSAAGHRKTLWSTIKSTLKAYFDTIYTNNGNLNNFKLGFGQVIINYGSVVVVGYGRVSARKVNNTTWLISGRSSYSRQAYTMEYGISLAQIGSILGLSLSGTNGLANMSILRYYNADGTMSHSVTGYGGCCEITNSNYYRPARYYNTSGSIGGWESTAIPEGAYIDFEIYATGS